MISERIYCGKAWGAVDSDRTVEEKGKAFKSCYQISGFICTELTFQYLLDLTHSMTD